MVVLTGASRLKTLVIALQRIGDILMVAPAIRAAKESNGELHLLIHRDCQAVQELLPFVDQFHYFERDTWQKSLGEMELSSWEGFGGLQQLVEHLHQQNFNSVYNFSHTKLAAYMTGLIGRQSYFGARIDAWGKAHFSSKWFADLDNLSALSPYDTFHMADYFAFGANQKVLTGATVGNRDANFIAIQPFTSEAKKNYPLEGFTELIRTIHSVRPQSRFGVLCAPFELNQLGSWISQVKSTGAHVELFSENLVRTQDLLSQASLLISADTSIKHLGVLQGASILELSLGSSNLFFTGSHCENALIVKSRESCAPCGIRGACHRDQHYCSKSLDPVALGMLATQLMENFFHQLKPIADEYRSQLEIYKPRFTADGLWHPIPQGERFSLTAVQNWVRRSFKSMQMTTTERFTLESYAELLRSLFPTASYRDWQQVFQDLIFPKDKDYIKKELIQCLKHSS